MVRPSFPGDTFQSDFITIQKSTQLRFLIIYKKSIFLQIAYLTYMHAKKQPDRNGLTALRLTLFSAAAISAATAAVSAAGFGIGAADAFGSALLCLINIQSSAADDDY